MEQVKLYLAILKKYHFWVLCAVGTLVGVICWWTSANGLAAETTKNRSTLKSSFDAVTREAGKRNPPNEKFELGVKEKDDQLKEKVFAEWQAQFAAQQQLFTWPESVQEKVAHLKPGEPIHKINRTYFQSNGVLLDELRTQVFETAQYRHIVEPEGGDAAAPAAGGVRQMAAGGEPVPIEITGLVVWDKAHREALEFRYDLRRSPEVPTDQSIRFAQEDIWMLQNMAQVIRNTNEGALDVLAAPIKKIESLDIAQWAINEAIAATPAVVAGPASAPGMGMEGAGVAPPMGGPPVEGGAGQSPDDLAKLSDAELLNGRYLSEKGQPLNAADPSPYAELRLMLVRMQIVIDQRKVPQLLVNCANATVPIEIVRVSMTPMPGQTGAMALGNAEAGGRQGFGASAPRGMGRMGRGMDDDEPMSRRQPAQPFGRGAAAPMDPGAGAANDPNVIEPTVWDINLEVCGLVQIYTTPDKEKLGSGSSAEPGKRPSGVPTTPVITPRGTSSNSGGDMRGFSGGRGR